MDYFKKRAKEILTNDRQLEYENPLSLGNAYKNLKAALRNPVIVHATSSDTKPHHLKMTFSMCRNAVNGDRFLEIAKLKELSQTSSKKQAYSTELASSILASKESKLNLSN
jgi:hypothetical protein